jgi:hypothetical protein
MRKGRGGRTTSAAVLFSEAAPKVQSGLRSIHLVRLKIEEIMLNELDAASANDLSQLVSNVRANIDHICRLLDVAEQSGVSAKEAIVINKLRNDIAKEEVDRIFAACLYINDSSFRGDDNVLVRQGAISKAMTRAGQHLNPRAVKAGGFTPLQKNSTFGGIPSSTHSSTSVSSSGSGRPSNAPALARSSSAFEHHGAADTFKPLSKTASFTSSSGSRRGVADASSSSAVSSGKASSSSSSSSASVGSMEAAAAAATSGVKRGAAGSFDPSVFSSRGAGGEGGAGSEDQRGVFVPRSDMDERQYAYIEKVRIYCTSDFAHLCKFKSDLPYNASISL